MDLEECLKRIKLCLKNKDFVYSRHFKERMRERRFEEKEFEEIIKNNELLSFEKQNKNLYKLLYYLNEEKDLVLIVNTNVRVKLVTVYKINNSKRIRNNEK